MKTLVKTFAAAALIAVSTFAMAAEYSDKSTPRVPDESTPDLVTNNPSYFTTGLY